MNILLIDTRVARYEDIVAAVDVDLAIGVTFDYYADTFETIKTRIGEALQLHAGNEGDNVMISSASSTSISVGLIQHNYHAPTFSMVAAASSASSGATAGRHVAPSSW